MWPLGTTAETVPADFIAALDQAVKITNWFENLAPDEIPPQWMWPFDWELEAHFDRVKEARDKKYNTNDSAEPDGEQWEENQYAARFK